MYLLRYLDFFLDVFNSIWFHARMKLLKHCAFLIYCDVFQLDFRHKCNWILLYTLGCKKVTLYNWVSWKMEDHFSFKIVNNLHKVVEIYLYSSICYSSKHKKKFENKEEIWISINDLFFDSRPILILTKLHIVFQSLKCCYYQ